MSAIPATRRSWDVAIVGYGPVGAFAALLLAEAGQQVVILERETQPVVLPRAVGLDGESVRAFQRIGLGAAVAKLLQPRREREEFCFTDSRRRRLLGVEMPPQGHNGWRDIAFFDQPELEAFLREQVATHAGIEVQLGREVVEIEQSERSVVLATGVPGGPADSEVSAAFAIGCDGASSFVRRSLGIPWDSLGYDQDWLVVDVTLDPQADLPITMMQVCDPQRLTTYIPGKDPYRRWEFQLLLGETREEMLRPERIQALLQPWLPPEHYALRRSAVYQFHAATAKQLRVGRIFLAGDAAHQTPPFLGQGLNSGFRDAVSLGWRLPLVLSGCWDPRLLDSYAAERDLHARDLVERAVGVGQLMETLAAREAGLPDPHSNAPQRAAPADGQLVPPLRQGTFVEAQIRTDRPVGRLLRQPTVRRAGSPTQHLDTLLGRGFAILGRSEDALQIDADSRALLERLGARRVNLAGLTCVEGSMDALFESHPAAVVRPDRYIFGVVEPGWSLDRLLEELAAKLAPLPRARDA